MSLMYPAEICGKAEMGLSGIRLFLDTKERQGIYKQNHITNCHLSGKRLIGHGEEEDIDDL